MENHGREMGGLCGAAMEDRSTKGIHPDILLAPGREGQRIRVSPRAGSISYEPVPEKTWTPATPNKKVSANPRIGIGGGPTRGTLLPADAEGRKRYPMATGLLDYFPDALAAVSHLSWKGNEQHNPGQALHWNRAKSADEADTLLRHLSQRGTVDADGVRHSVKVAWRALALLQKELEEEGQTAVRSTPKAEDAMKVLPPLPGVAKGLGCVSEEPRRYTCPKDGASHCCTLEGRKACDEMVAIEKAAQARLLENSRVAEAELQRKAAEQKLCNEAAIKEVSDELRRHGFRIRITDLRDLSPEQLLQGGR